MALVLKDRVKEVTTSTGTGTITLGGAATGFQSFTAVGDGNTTYYTIADQSGTNWEVGIGTYTASGTTLSRDTVLSSSNSGSLVSFGAGNKDVFVTYPSERSETAQIGDIKLASEAPTGPGTWLETGKYYSKAAYPDLATKLGNIADFGTFATVPQAQLPQPFTFGGKKNVATDGTITIAAGSGGAVRKTTDGVNWVGVPSTTTVQAYFATYANGKFFVGGGSGSSYGSLIYSSNAEDWVNVTTFAGGTSADNFYGLAYGAGNYVAVTNTGKIFYSSDLASWTFAGTYGTVFITVIYANSLFVAAGNSGAVYTSSDGVTWTSRSAGAQLFLDVIYANSLFVAVGANGAAYTSPDGVTWTSRSAGASNLNKVIYANSLFVAVGASGVVYTSTDGATWTGQTSGTAVALNSVCWNGSNFVAVGSSAVYITSPDGITWTVNSDVSATAFQGVAVVSGKTIAFGTSSCVVIAGATRQEVLQSGTWAYSVSTQSAANPRVIAYNGSNLYVAAGNAGQMFKSTDGQTWTNNPTSTIGQVTDKVAYLNGNWIAMGGNGSGTNLLTSSDGSTWTARTAGTAIFNYAAYGAGVYVVVGASGAVYSSPDLVTWTSRSAGSNTFNDVIFANGVFVAVGASNSVYSSADGITWTLRTATGVFNRVVYENSLFVAVGGTALNNNSVIYTSPDGATWTARTGNVALPLLNIAWNGSLFVAVGQSGAITSSSDGLTWTARTPGDTAVALNSISWDGTRFVVTNTTSGVAWTSTDGITWTRSATAYAGAILYSGYLGGKFIAVGANQIQYSTDGLNWKNADPVQYVPTALNRTYKLGGKYYALSTTAGIYQSDDGVTWSAARTAPVRPFVGMAYSGSIWTAVTGTSTGMPTSVYKSTDGTTWTKAADFGTLTNTSTLPTAFIDIEYANGNFIIGCPVTTAQNIVYTIYTSSDGVTWTGRLTPLLIAPTQAIGSDGNTAVIGNAFGSLKSTDGGITWTSVYTSNSTGWVYTNGAWMGLQTTSPDLVNFYFGGTPTGFIYVANNILYQKSNTAAVSIKQINTSTTVNINNAPNGLDVFSIGTTYKAGVIRGTTALVVVTRTESIAPNLLEECSLYSYDTATTFLVPPSSAGGGQVAYIYAGA